MEVDKKIHHSKKAIVTGIALLDLNFIFILSAFHTMPTGLSQSMITAVLALVGVYLGAQGGVDMIQSSKLKSVKDDKKNKDDDSSK